MVGEWTLVLLLWSGHGFSHSTMNMPSEAVCEAKGKSWKEKMTIIHNPDSSWRRAVRRSAKYECVKL